MRFVHEAFISRNMNFFVRLLCNYIFTIMFLGRIFSDLRNSVTSDVVWDNSIKVMPDTAQGERKSLPNFQMRRCVSLSVIYNGFLAGNSEVSIDHEPYFRRT